MAILPKCILTVIRVKIAFPHLTLSLLNRKADEIPVIEEEEVTDCSKFEQLYLIGKIMGVTIPLKTTMIKATVEWKVIGDVSIVDKGNGYSLVKYTNAINCTRIPEIKLGS